MTSALAREDLAPPSRLAIAALSCVVLVTLSIVFVDRPLALLMPDLASAEPVT